MTQRSFSRSFTLLIKEAIYLIKSERVKKKKRKKRKKTEKINEHSKIRKKKLFINRKESFKRYLVQLVKADFKQKASILL